MTCSFGIASLKGDRPTSANSLISMADRSLYAAKDRGKNTIVTFSEVEAPAEAKG